MPHCLCLAVPPFKTHLFACAKSPPAHPIFRPSRTCRSPDLPPYTLSHPAHAHAPGLYPGSADEYEALSAAIERLSLNDASVTVRKETSDALGAGFRCGFLGPLHLEVFLQRLQQEHAASVISTAPTVPYEVELLGGGGERLVLQSTADFPRNTKLAAIYEPTVHATIICPQQFCGAVMKLAAGRRSTQLDYTFLGGSSKGGSNCNSAVPSSAAHASSESDPLVAAAAAAGTGGDSQVAASGGEMSSDRVLLRYELPLSELAGDFYSRLKSATQG